MSVTEAARKLGVGRPALSNLLNGRASLSQDMAFRLEGTFGADRTKLLALQVESDQARRRAEERAVPVGTHAPSFLTIKARQIAGWAAENIQAREHLPVLLRRLVHATGRELGPVDFPGYDNAQRHGWDGWVEAGAATPWVPEAKSGWEFGVHQRPGWKADHDYRARLNTVSAVERAACTFVFVTPRNWKGKTQWVRAREAAGDWKAVRALDASDLEQWLETTIAPRIWLAGELGILSDFEPGSPRDFETVDQFWNRWAAASDPPMTPAIFAPSVGVHMKRFKAWLETARPDRPFTVAADSREEAVAFVACLLRQEDAPAGAHDRAVVFESPRTLKALARSSSPFIPIVHNEEVERELAVLYRQRHCIVARPRNAIDRNPEVAVELLSHSAFEQALTDMGIERARVDRLARESGRSPTVLRRQLSQFPAIKRPSWAEDERVARRVMPMALVGAWHNGSKADCEVLAALSGGAYQGVEEAVAALLRYDDCPVWSVDRYRGVVSKIDALFAVATWMTAKDVTDFVELAEYVLSEAQPALDLPEDQRWAADPYGRAREHSGALRTGICETLVMLSVYGNDLFRDRLGIDVAALVAVLVKRLVTPLTSDKLRWHDGDLPAYAEAAPNVFLGAVEKDLERPKSILQGLLKPARVGLFHSNPPVRTGVLRALERLAWNRQSFRRVVNILARLSQTKIDDNWYNKPANSLAAILSSRLPQTAAPLGDRINALEALCREFPDVGWQVCIQQFERRGQIGHYNARPRWRNDAAGAGHRVLPGEGSEFERKALDLAIAWPTHDRTTLGDLVERCDNLPDKDQSSVSVWERVDAWSRTATDHAAKAELRERIRRSVPIQRRSAGGSESTRWGRVREIVNALAPGDPVVRHRWLFARSWVDFSADDLDDADLDFDEREQRIHELRTNAMAEIWSARGRDGIFALLADCDARTVGRYAASRAVEQQAVADVFRASLSAPAASGVELDHFMGGFLAELDDDTRTALIATVTQSAAVGEAARIMACAPFRDRTWRLLDGQDGRVRERYWRTVAPTTERFTESETTEMLDGLLAAGRPRPAFHAVRFDWSRVETSRLQRLVNAVVDDDTEPADEFRIDAWRLSEALDSLDGRPGITADEMAQLEFACIDALASLGPAGGRSHGIPNLERKIAESPALFVQAVALVFKRDDGAEDPSERHVEEQMPRVNAGRAAYHLLEQLARIPGTDDEGGIDAHRSKRWIAEARPLCREHGRARVGDERIGQLFSKAPPEEDGSWPCRPVCEVLESIASEDIARGFVIGVYNARGVHSRSLDEGGKQERELSAKYRDWGQRLAFDYPYVARILERIAESYERDAEREDSEVRVMKRLER